MKTKTHQYRQIRLNYYELSKILQDNGVLVDLEEVYHITPSDEETCILDIVEETVTETHEWDYE